MDTIDRLCVDTLRFLAVDMVEEAKSGHPGLPLGAAPMLFAIWDRFLRFDPAHPDWPDRDRFVLSAGHGSALLYAALHLYGYDLPIDELRRFRAWGSRTPGHPEYGRTPGVDCTTGPLGQGFAMAVGMAAAEAHLAARLGPAARGVVDHRTFALVSDGDMMEGISNEAASLAGTLGLGKLVVLYDDNGISIEGPVSIAFTEDVEARFRALGWGTMLVDDGEDVDGIAAAIEAACGDPGRPSLILVSTHIGYGSPKQDSAAAHGEPLGNAAARETKRNLGWPQEPTFLVPEEARAHAAAAVARGRAARDAWLERAAILEAKETEAASLFRQTVAGGLPVAGSGGPLFAAGDRIATRSASETVLNRLAAGIPGLVGGSADLAPSTRTVIEGGGDMARGEAGGRNIHFGVREHAMGAFVNGMALHGGLLPFCATFLVFSDYMRPALRLAAMMGVRAIFLFTHDSIGLGEDGPTHQPIEQAMSLRLIPGLAVFRPADANETAAAWRLAVERDGPSAILLSRQKLAVLDPDVFDTTAGPARGAYVLADAPAPDIVIAATGSEVHLALEAQDSLRGRGTNARVVSVVSWELFAEQAAEYRRTVLSPPLPRLTVEAGVTSGWVGWETGNDAIGLDRFGASAPGETVMQLLGFETERIVEAAETLVGKR
ncbi:MAG: transketolase [Candidatus Krumholzibacteriota bacterium]|nr:transketolase [Candidatus Krumholzibacteriota bacterium]